MQFIQQFQKYIFSNKQLPELSKNTLVKTLSVTKKESDYTVYKAVTHDPIREYQVCEARSEASVINIDSNFSIDWVNNHQTDQIKLSFLNLGPSNEILDLQSIVFKGLKSKVAIIGTNTKSKLVLTLDNQQLIWKTCPELEKELTFFDSQVFALWDTKKFKSRSALRLGDEFYIQAQQAKNKFKDENSGIVSRQKGECATYTPVFTINNLKNVEKDQVCQSSACHSLCTLYKFKNYE